MEIEKLQSLNIKDVKKFSFNGMTFTAKIVKVYDGDTVTAIFKYNEIYYKWNCRLNCIDTPELKTKNIDEKLSAIKAKNYLSEKILNKIVMLHCNDFDKYGRLLVIVEYDNTNINNLMIIEGYAKEYFGGKKDTYLSDIAE